MASTRQLIAMIRSHVSGDNVRFLSIAETIADEANKAGRARMAGDLMPRATSPSRGQNQ